MRQNAWNQTWLDFTAEEVRGLLPSGGTKGSVPDALARRIYRKSLIDNVRGQTDEWRDNEIKRATLTTETVGSKNGQLTVRLHGEFEAEDDTHSMKATLHGRAVFDTGANRFVLIELAAVGTRRGGTQFNKRDDEAQTPIGFAFMIENQYDKKSKKP
jgi:hypothetical protein